MTYNEAKRKSIEKEIEDIKRKIELLEEEILMHEERISELEEELDIDFEAEEEIAYLVDKQVEGGEC